MGYITVREKGKFLVSFLSRGAKPGDFSPMYFIGIEIPLYSPS